MSQFGHVSAVNLSRQCNIIDFSSPQSACRNSCTVGQMNGLSFAVGEAMGHKLSIPAASFTRKSRRDAFPLKVCSQNVPYNCLDIQVIKELH